mgnify:FL=1
MLYYILVPLAWVLAHIVFRPQVIGRENLIKGRGFILAPNHRSALDPVFVVVSDGYFWLHKMRIFAKKELFQGKPLLAWFLRQMGAVSVKNGRDDLSTLDNTIQECRTGRGLLLFPEGTRSKDGRLLPPKSGAFVVADQAAVDMIPCRILYDTPDGRLKLFCRIRICFGKPISAEQLALGEKRNMVKLRENKKMLTAAWEEMGREYAFSRCVQANAEKEKTE